MTPTRPFTLPSSPCTEDPHAIFSGLCRFRALYRDFNASRLASDFDRVYAADCRFKDGFREAFGSAALYGILLRFTRESASCSLSIADVVTERENVFICWEMHLRLNRNPRRILTESGVSHLKFDDRGRVLFHRDFPNLGAHLARLPVIGPAVHWMRQRL